jgi:two-component SAPR family response regulator
MANKEKDMIRLLFVGSSTDSFKKMIKALQDDRNVTIEQAGSGGDTLAWLLKNSTDLVVAAEQLDDMNGLEFARKLVVQNPMVNCALVSSLSEDDFHEASEGLGILAKLPPDPGESEAGDLLKKIGVIKRLGS